jgi:hypothetical protein
MIKNEKLEIYSYGDKDARKKEEKGKEIEKEEKQKLFKASLFRWPAERTARIRYLTCEMVVERTWQKPGDQHCFEMCRENPSMMIVGQDGDRWSLAPG